MATHETTAVPRLPRVVTWIVIAFAVLWGVVLIGVAVTLGHCSAFGGRCPADPPPLFDDDVFGLAAVGAALLVGVPTAVIRPTLRRLPVAVGWALAAALVVGLTARSIAHG